MSKYPDKVKPRALRKPIKADATRVERASAANPFFSFRYSYQEMHLAEGRTHVKSKEIRWEDGRVQSEEFEGTLPATFYERWAADTQRFFAEQTMSFLKQFSALLPLPHKDRDDAGK